MKEGIFSFGVQDVKWRLRFNYNKFVFSSASAVLNCSHFHQMVTLQELFHIFYILMVWILNWSSLDQMLISETWNMRLRIER